MKFLKRIRPDFNLLKPEVLNNLFQNKMTYRLKNLFQRFSKLISDNISKRLTYYSVIIIIIGAAIVFANLPDIIVQSRFSPNENEYQIESSAYSNIPLILCPIVPGSSKNIMYNKNTFLKSTAIEYNKKKFKHITPPTSYPSKISQPIVITNAKTLSTLTYSISNSTRVMSCAKENSDAWFVGGATDINSSDQIIMANTGNSMATVSIVIYSNTRSFQVVSRNIKPNSQVTYSLTKLAPGEKSVVIHIVTISGRVVSMLLDNKSKGLTNFGFSLINPTQSPARNINILGLSTVDNKSTVVRIFNASDKTANVSAQIFNSSGSFTPVGLDNLLVPAQRIVDVSIPQLPSAAPFALKLTSNQGIVAAGIVNDVSGYSWFPAARPFKTTTITLPSITPILIFRGEEIKVKVNWTARKSGVSNESYSNSKLISASNFYNLKLPSKTTSITITPLSGDGNSLATILSNYPDPDAPFYPINLLGRDLSNLNITPYSEARTIARGQ